MLGPRQQLKRVLSQPGIVQACGVGDAGQAKLVEEAGFPVVYMSGNSVSFTYGLPDVGFLTLSEMAERAASIARRVKIPLIADADTGYGEAIAVMRTVQSYEEAGVAAFHLEDELPKKLGMLAPVESMVTRIKAAVESRSDPSLYIIGRTDALAPWRRDLELAKQEDDCLKRCLSYAEAGADIIMVLSPRSEKALRRFCQTIPRPILVLGGCYDYDPSAAELQEIGVRIVVYPVFIREKTVPFIRRSLRDLLSAGKVSLSQNEREQRDTLNNILGLALYKEIQDRFRA
ncbi:MAG: isocitrate lyase/PEP mutase family protein [Chloroflexota bacterium]